MKCGVPGTDSLVDQENEKVNGGAPGVCGHFDEPTQAKTALEWATGRPIWSYKDVSCASLAPHVGGVRKQFPLKVEIVCVVFFRSVLLWVATTVFAMARGVQTQGPIEEAK